MSKYDISYSSLGEYWEDVLHAGKCYILEYLQQLVQVGSDKSQKQHLFQETLLRKEVINYLEGDMADKSKLDGKEYESCINKKADASMKNELFLPLEYLCRVFSLNSFERFCVTLLAASEIDANIDKAFAYINNDWKRSTLSIEMAMEIYHTHHNEFGSVIENEIIHLYPCFAKDAKLFRYFLEIPKVSNENYLKRELRFKPRIFSFLFEGIRDCCEIENYVQYYAPGAMLDPLLLEDKPYLNMLHFITSNNQDATTLFYLYGANGIGKKLNIKYFANQTNQAVFFLSLDSLEGASIDLYALMQMIIAEVIIKQGLLCICSNNELLAENEKERALIHTILTALKNELPIIFLVSDCTKKAGVKSDFVNIISIEMVQHTLEENHRFWVEIAKGYPISTDVDLEELSNKFLLSPGQIKEIFEEAWQLSIWYGQAFVSNQILLKVCFGQIEHNLGKRAQKVKMMYHWEDLILPEYQKNMLKVACNQIKYKYKVFSGWGFDEKMAYGTGLSLIFSGSPGTGKTMAAQVIANELGLELYKIELASVVSKYIGETERNLNEIFEEAKKSQGIIFFDEADVLFSKRSEVKDSNDKYSNMEAAFMLQKIEEYTGIVILATNYQQNIDEAFKRRIKFLIDFPFPDSSYRKKLWLNAFPDRLPQYNDIDIDFIAEKFELSGSNIKNVALNAAFLAASEESCVGMAHIIKSVVHEFTKSGKKLSKEDLGEYYMFI